MNADLLALGESRAYLTRRRAEGKTDREIRRCLKRYIARHLYRALTTAMAQAAASAEFTTRPT